MKRSAPMRRTPMRRTSRIARKTRINPRRKRERRGAGEKDPAYRFFLRSQRVCGLVRAVYAGRLSRARAAKVGPCGGRMTVEHERQHVGKGMKADDRRAWECCWDHHRQRHDKQGVWADLTLDEERELIAGNIDDANARYLSHGSRRAA